MNHESYENQLIDSTAIVILYEDRKYIELKNKFAIRHSRFDTNRFSHKHTHSHSHFFRLLWTQTQKFTKTHQKTHMHIQIGYDLNTEHRRNTYFFLQWNEKSNYGFKFKMKAKKHVTIKK